MFKRYKKGGKVKAKSKVNEAGNYTKPTMRKRQFSRIKSGTKAAKLVSGRRVKRTCSLKHTKMLVGATPNGN